jgi:acyl-CoA thioester hydrolase
MSEAGDAAAEVSALLADYRVTIEVPLHWGDQDALGHVNHVRYFRWYETARIVYAERVGLMALHREQRIGPILASVSNDYRRQLTFPDTVDVGVRVTRIGVSSIGLEHRIVSRAQGALAAEGTSTFVVFDYNLQRPTRVPDSLRRAIEALEGREFPRS